MLVVMFALLLLSVIGLGMMYSTNMESAINSNYRDKQVALYAALGGLQEARDRIQPAERALRPQKSVLAGILRVVFVAHEPHEIGEDLRPVSLRKGGEGDSPHARLFNTSSRPM